MIIKEFLTDKKNIILILLVFLLAVFSFWHLSSSPATWMDEGINIGIAKSLVTSGVYSLEVSPDNFVAQRPFLITTNYPVLLPVAFFVKLFGFNLFWTRVVMIIFIFLFAGAFFKLSKDLYSKEAAIMALALIVSFVPFYGNGKAVLGEVPGLAYFLLGLIFLNKDFSFKRFFLAGLFFGLSMATKPFFLIIVPAVFLGELYRYWKIRDNFWRRTLTLFLGAMLPVLAWIFSILPNISISGIVQMIGYYSNSYAAENFGQAIIKNVARFFTESTPIHFAVLAFALLFFIFLKVRQKQNFKEAEVILFVFIFLTFLWYLKTPGWYRYFFPAHLLLFMFFPVALFSIFKKKFVFFLILIAFFAQLAYLMSVINNWLYDSNETLRLTSYIMEETPYESSVFIANNPSAAFSLRDRQIYQYLRINPELFFGTDSLKDKEGLYYEYIAIAPQETNGIYGLSELLEGSYQKIYEFGHYVLYKKI